MNKKILGLLAAVLLFGWSALARAAAADPGITVSLVPVPDKVTLSRPAGTRELPLTTYAAYRVTLTNDTTNTLNRVFFNATVRYVGTSEAVVIDGTVPAAAPCTISGATIDCRFGSLAPGLAFDFYFVVKAPLAGSRIEVAGLGGGDEGNGGGNGCCDAAATASTQLIDPTTDPSVLTNAQTFVRPAGATFFTGLEAVATERDGWTTLVKATNLLTLTQTTGTIAESPVLGSCAPYALGCFKTDLNMPGVFDLIEITIDWDEKYHRLNQRTVAEAKLFYVGSSTTVPYPLALRLCSEDQLTYGSAPSAGRPCLAELPKLLTNKDTPVKSSWGDVRYRALAIDNGQYSN